MGVWDHECLGRWSRRKVCVESETVQWGHDDSCCVTDSVVGKSEWNFLDVGKNVGNRNWCCQSWRLPAYSWQRGKRSWPVFFCLMLWRPQTWEVHDLGQIFFCLLSVFWYFPPSSQNVGIVKTKQITLITGWLSQCQRREQMMWIINTGFQAFFF